MDEQVEKEVEAPSELVNANQKRDFSKMDVNAKEMEEMDEKAKKRKMDVNAKKKKKKKMMTTMDENERSKLKELLLPREELDFGFENKKLWKSNGGKYEDPTLYEREVIRPYLRNYKFEAEDYVEGKWLRSLAKKHNCPNIRLALLDFLHQVRESKGYDVTYRPGFLGSRLIPSKVPVRGDIDYDHFEEGKAAVIRGMNAQMKESGKRYEIVSVDKVVWTPYRVALFTLTVKEVEVVVDCGDAHADGYESLKTVRAMLFKRFPMIELLEWKFK